MSLYYADDDVSLYLGDCRRTDVWMRADVLVTDPPYGMDYRSHATDRYEVLVGDQDAALRDWILRVWGRRPALVFGTWRVPRPPHCRTLLVWDKGFSPGAGDLDLPWGPSHEEVYVLGQGFSGRREASVLRVDRLTGMAAARPDHPTPKPVALMEYLILRCPPGLIADPCAGAGATLLAAKRLGRKAVGVEIEERFCEVAAKRLAQGVLPFLEVEPA